MGKTLALFMFCLCSPSWALEINQASEADLDGLRGLGPAFTRRVMRERDIRPFTDWPDLMRRVAGMGRVTADKLADQGLTVSGQTLVKENKPPKLAP
jgi:competence protein ComEA